jgi:hypothetical protein
MLMGRKRGVGKNPCLNLVAGGLLLCETHLSGEHQPRGEVGSSKPARVRPRKVGLPNALITGGWETALISLDARNGRCPWPVLYG